MTANSSECQSRCLPPLTVSMQWQNNLMSYTPWPSCAGYSSGSSLYRTTCPNESLAQVKSSKPPAGSSVARRTHVPFLRIMRYLLTVTFSIPMSLQKQRQFRRRNDTTLSVVPPTVLARDVLENGHAHAEKVNQIVAFMLPVAFDVLDHLSKGVPGSSERGFAGGRMIRRPLDPSAWG